MPMTIADGVDLAYRHTPLFLAYASTEYRDFDRLRTVTATQSPALLSVREDDGDSDEDVIEANANPYMTAFELFQLVTGRIQPEPRRSNVQSWSQALRETVAGKLVADNDWSLRRPEGVYLHPTVQGMSAYVSHEVDEGRGVFVPLFLRIMDSFAFSRQWTKADGDTAVPAYQSMMIQHVLSVTGAPYALFGVLVGGVKSVIVRVDRDEDLIQTIVSAVQQFWANVDADEEYVPDFERDQKVIQTLALSAEPGSTIDLSDDPVVRRLASDYKRFGAEKSAADKAQREVKARILDHIQGHQNAVVGPDLTIVAQPVHRQETVVAASSYITLRINPPRKSHAGKDLATAAATPRATAA